MSLFCLTDGEHVVPLAPAQDFKRVGDGDTGPNTGGMGAYSPLDWAPAGLVDEVVARVAQPTVDEMRRRGTPFAGVLYVGLALTSRGPRVDRVQRPLRRPRDPGRPRPAPHARSAQLLHGGGDRAASTRSGRCAGATDHAVTVVVALDGLPGRAAHRRPDRRGRLPPRLPTASTCCTPAPPSDADGTLVSAGGRVLSVVALGADLAAGARAGLRRASDTIALEGGHHRTDIALAADRGEVTVPGVRAG